MFRDSALDRIMYVGAALAADFGKEPGCRLTDVIIMFSEKINALQKV